MFGITCAPRLRRVRSNNGYLSLPTAVSHPFFNLSIKTDLRHPSPSFPYLRIIYEANFYQFSKTCIRKRRDLTDKISLPPFLLFLSTKRYTEIFSPCGKGGIKLLEFEEKYRNFEAGCWDTCERGEKKSLLSPRGHFFDPFGRRCLVVSPTLTS